MSSVPSYEANSGASIAQSAIERKQKQKIDNPAQIPTGNDGKKYRNNFIKTDIHRVLEINLMKIMIF